MQSGQEGCWHSHRPEVGGQCFPDGRLVLLWLSVLPTESLILSGNCGEEETGGNSRYCYICGWFTGAGVDRKSL